MANRAYLYSTDQIPNHETKKISIKGLSEWNYLVPPVYLLLVSGDTQLCKSIIWEDNPEKISLVGEYKKGVQNLKKLLDLIKRTDVQNPEVFNRVASEAIDFLESEKHKQKYILLEPGEIFELGSGQNENESHLLLEVSKGLLKDINCGRLEGINEYIGDDIKTHWEDSLGINYWSEVLYFHFG